MNSLLSCRRLGELTSSPKKRAPTEAGALCSHALTPRLADHHTGKDTEDRGGEVLGDARTRETPFDEEALANA